MVNKIFGYTILFIVLVLSQVIIFNNLCIFNVAIPYAFILFILHLPININLNLLYLLSFLLGFTIDIFFDTLGMNALACVLISAIRKPVFLLFYSRDDDKDNVIPSINIIGNSSFIKYASMMSLIYCVLLNIIQSFTFSNITLLVIRSLSSAIATFLVIWAIESLISSGSAKRL